MVTIKDVARHAGVSVGTVSNVLNNVPTVSDENRERVGRAINALNYRRNIAASQLRSNHSFAIGLIVPTITSPYYAEVARAVDDTSRRMNYQMFLCNRDRDGAREESLVAALLAKNVDGLIIFKPMLQREAMERIQKDCPVVVADADPEKFSCDIVNTDNYRTMRLGIEEAVKLGHRRVGMIYGQDGSDSTCNRVRAYRDAVREYGLIGGDAYLADGRYTVDGGMDAFRELMSLPSPPTVVVTLSDLTAKGALYQANEMGIRIPETVSLIGFDDIGDAKWTVPSLSTIWQPKYELGENCMHLLMRRITERIKGQQSEREIRMLQGHYIARDSLQKPS